MRNICFWSNWTPRSINFSLIGPSPKTKYFPALALGLLVVGSCRLFCKYHIVRLGPNLSLHSWQFFFKVKIWVLKLFTLTCLLLSFTIMGSWRRSDNLRFFGLVRFSERSGVASSFSPFSPLSITMKPALFLIVFPVVFFDNLLTKESGFCFPEVLSSGSISWAGSLCTCFLCIFNPFLEVFFLPHILHLWTRPSSFSSIFFFWPNWTLFSSFPPGDGNDDGDDDNDKVLEGWY